MDWKRWWKEGSSKKFEIRILGPEAEILRRTPWSRIRDKTACTKNSWRLLAMGVQRAGFQSRQVLFPSQLHHQIRLRILSCGRMSENHRGPEVPEEEVPVVECRDGTARITLEELATTHFVKSGILQNACSTRPRVVVGSGNSALMHIVKLMNSRLKGPKRMMTKVQ